MMKITRFTRLASSALIGSSAFSNAQAAYDKLLLQLATCQESWMNWDISSPKVDRFRKMFSTDFIRKAIWMSASPSDERDRRADTAAEVEVLLNEVRLFSEV